MHGFIDAPANVRLLGESLQCSGKPEDANDTAGQDDQ